MVLPLRQAFGCFLSLHVDRRFGKWMPCNFTYSCQSENPAAPPRNELQWRVFGGKIGAVAATLLAAALLAPESRPTQTNTKASHYNSQANLSRFDARTALNGNPSRR